MAPQNVEYLREHGPSTIDELPYKYVRPRDRIAGVWKFGPKGSGGGAPVGNTGGTLINVYYLRDEHSPDEVVAKWAEVNAENIEQSPPRGFRRRVRRQGEEFHDAIDEYIPPQGDAY